MKEGIELVKNAETKEELVTRLLSFDRIDGICFLFYFTNVYRYLT